MKDTQRGSRKTQKKKKGSSAPEEKPLEFIIGIYWVWGEKEKRSKKREQSLKSLWKGTS